MDRVRKFLFEKELLGKGAKTEDAVGIEFRDKTVLGDKANVKLRFDATYMDAAARASSDRSVECSFDRSTAMRLVNMRPGRQMRFYLAALPFVLLVVAYFIGSNARLTENPNDKLLPALSSMAQAVKQMAFQADTRTGDVSHAVRHGRELWPAGLSAGNLDCRRAGSRHRGRPVAWREALLGPFVSVMSMVPPLALLPILFIVMGLGEDSKIALIVIGTLPCIIRDLALRVQELPREQLIKAQTLGASTWQIALRVVTAANTAAINRLAAAAAWTCVAVSDSRRGHRLRFWPRLPHLSGPALSRHGRDPALRRLDHASRLPDGCWPAPAPAQGVSLVRVGEGGMSAIRFDDVWKEYGDHIVLEQITLDVEPRAFRRACRSVRMRQDHVPAHAAWRGEPDAREDSCGWCAARA